MIVVLLARFIVTSLFFGCFQIFSAIIASGVSSKIKLTNPASSLVVNSAIQNFTGLVLDPFSKVKGKSVEIKNGRVEVGNFCGLITGVFDPSNPANLTLDGGRSFWGEVGTKVSGVLIAGAGNQLGGWVEVGAPIVLQDASSVLFLGLSNNLTKDIQLNGGLLRLFSSLECNKGTSIVGSGTVDLSEKAVILRSEASTFSGNITWTGGGQIILYEKAAISGVWTIDAQTVAITKIEGMGQCLDFSKGGTLVIKAGSNVVFDDVVLQGLKTGSILFEDETAVASFVGCSLQLVADYAIPHGKIIFSGQDSVLIAGDSVCSFGGSSQLVVDGVSLYYDPLNFAHGVGITVEKPANIIELNGGRIASIHKRDIAPRLIVDGSIVGFGQMDITAEKPLWFRGLSGDLLDLQGSGLVLHCANDLAQKGSALIVLDDKKRATLRDVVINNFDPQVVKYGNDADIFFGDNTELVLSHAVTFQKPLHIVGNAILRGCGDIVDISSGQISVAANSSLVLQDIVLVGLGNSLGTIVLHDATSSVIFKNVTLVLNDDYNQAAGKWFFQGSSSTIITGNYLATFDQNAQCVFDGVNVEYDPLSYPDQHNIRAQFAGASNLIFSKGGSLSLVNESRVAGNLDITVSSYTLQRNEMLTTVRPMQIVGDDSVCTIDGQGFSLLFAFSNSPVLRVAAGRKLVLQNVVLQDFQSAHVFLGTGASLEFGDNVAVKFSRDFRLSSTISISGKTVIDCGGNKIIFDPGCGFVLGNSGVLELRNGHLENLKGAQDMFVANTASKVVLQDMMCTLSGDFTFSQGCLEVGGWCTFLTHQHVFKYNSRAPLVIKSHATLSFEEGSQFFLDVPLAKSGLLFADKSSCLRLASTSLSVGRKGLVFDQGLLQVEGTCVVNGGIAKGCAGVTFKEKTFDVAVSLKSLLDLQGLIIYE